MSAQAIQKDNYLICPRAERIQDVLLVSSGIIYLTPHDPKYSNEAVSARTASEAGAPDTTIPEPVLLEAAGRLANALGVGVPLADYAEVAALLFAELSDHGWLIVPPASHIRPPSGKTNRTCIRDSNPVFLEARHRYASWNK